MTDAKTPTVTVDGTEYNVNDLSDNAKQQIVNVNGVDAEIEKLKQRLAITQTARKAYAKALSAELPKATH